MRVKISPSMLIWHGGEYFTFSYLLAAIHSHCCFCSSPCPCCPSCCSLLFLYSFTTVVVSLAIDCCFLPLPTLLLFLLLLLLIANGFWSWAELSWTQLIQTEECCKPRTAVICWSELCWWNSIQTEDGQYKNYCVKLSWYKVNWTKDRQIQDSHAKPSWVELRTAAPSQAENKQTKQIQTNEREPTETPQSKISYCIMHLVGALVSE